MARKLDSTFKKLITPDDTKVAIDNLKAGRASDCIGVVAEAFKLLDASETSMLTDLCNARAEGLAFVEDIWTRIATHLIQKKVALHMHAHDVRGIGIIVVTNKIYKAILNNKLK